MLSRLSYRIFSKFSFKESWHIVRLLTANKLLVGVPAYIIDRFNLYNRILLRRSNVVSNGKTEILIKYSHEEYGTIRFLLRRKSSDFVVFDEVIVQESYKAFLEMAKRKYGDNGAPTIIDAGANIGTSSIYFSLCFPRSRIFAVEPSADNFRSLVNNIELNNSKNIEAIQCGIWNKNIFLSVDDSFRDGRDWSITLSESRGQNGVVEAITLKSLMERLSIKKIDILKIDIEGAEKQLFEDEHFVNTILGEIALIVVEVHTEFISVNAIVSIMESNGFSWALQKELVIAYNKKFIQ